MTYTLTLDGGRVIEATEEQVAIIEWAKGHPTECLLINSLAGSAKTSTLRFLAKYLSVIPTLSVAFNKRIVDELVKVLPGHVKPSTVNSVGHRAFGSAIGKRLTVSTNKNGDILKAMIEKRSKREQREVWDVFSDLVKAVSTAKLSGYVPRESVHSKSLISADEFFGSLDEEPDAWFMDLVNKMLAESIRQSFAGLIDFDDQIYMSTLFGGQFPSFPRIMLDEAQDLSRINHAMLDKLMSKGTQLIGVGDRNQSIYAFRGAMTTSMEELKQRYSMHEMTLSVSFRCPQSVVRRAWWRTPNMKWPEWAIEGTVERLEEWNAKDIPDGSAIICRNNAPLLSCALNLLRQGRGIRLVGTDLGPQLVRALKKFGGVSNDLSQTQEQVLAKINDWETEKLQKARNASVVSDKAECLRVFANFGPTLGAAIAYAEHIFNAKGPIQLMSGHKAKGLEFDVVYHLDPHRIPSPWCREGEALEQEMNVRYVIETRPKRELYLVSMDNFNGDDPDVI
jgi:DNA helicase-2/ATP-dependent DNA helicase PcrA